MEKTDEITVKKPERLQSLDILRGFDMFWIIGGGSLIVALSQVESLHWLVPFAVIYAHFRCYNSLFGTGKKRTGSQEKCLAAENSKEGTYTFCARYFI